MGTQYMCIISKYLFFPGSNVKNSSRICNGCNLVKNWTIFFPMLYILKKKKKKTKLNKKQTNKQKQKTKQNKKKSSCTLFTTLSNDQYT